MQKIFITGFVGRIPEEKFTAGGKKVTTFPLAINVKKGGEKLTLWYKVNCWEGICTSILSHIQKGNCVTVVGDLNPPTTYQNKQGDIAIDMSITCQSISFSPSYKSQEDKKEDPAVFDFGDTK